VSSNYQEVFKHSSVEGPTCRIVILRGKGAKGHSSKRSPERSSSPESPITELKVSNCRAKETTVHESILGEFPGVERPRCCVQPGNTDLLSRNRTLQREICSNDLARFGMRIGGGEVE